VSVVNTGSDSGHISDPLIKSLLGNDPEADFQLFHGIPPFWARTAYALRNVIAMTVWETDTMPPQWRNPLMHAVDVWLPSSFNVEVFGRGLGRPAFRLPHPAPVAALRDALTGAMKSAYRQAISYFTAYSSGRNARTPTGLSKPFCGASPESATPYWS
jgi:hypothetical protein